MCPICCAVGAKQSERRNYFRAYKSKTEKIRLFCPCFILMNLKFNTGQIQSLVHRLLVKTVVIFVCVIVGCITQLVQFWIITYKSTNYFFANLNENGRSPKPLQFQRFPIWQKNLSSSVMNPE